MILENLILPVLSGIFYVAVADYISDRDIIFYVSGSICFTAVGASVGGISMLISSERRFGTLYATIGSVFHPIYLFLGRILYWCAVFSDLHSTQWDRLFCWDHRVAKTECHGHQFSCGKSAVIV